MRHLTLPQLSASIDDALSGVSLELVRRHLADCEECRSRQAKLARVDGLLALLISHDPGEAWHTAAAEELAEHIVGEATGVAAQPRHRAGPPPWQTMGERPRVVEPVGEADPAWFAEAGAPEAPAAPAVHAVPVAPVVPVAKPAPTPAAAHASPSRPASPQPVASEAGANLPPPSAPVSAAAKQVPIITLSAAPKYIETPPAAARPTPPAPARPTAPIAPVSSSRAVSPPPPAPPRRDPVEIHRSRLRRNESSRPREAVVPLVAGLVGGAIAGAIIVGLMFSPRLANRRASPPSRSSVVEAGTTGADPALRAAGGERRGPEITSVTEEPAPAEPTSASLAAGTPAVRAVEPTREPAGHAEALAPTPTAVPSPRVSAPKSTVAKPAITTAAAPAGNSEAAPGKPASAEPPPAVTVASSTGARPVGTAAPPTEPRSGPAPVVAQAPTPAKPQASNPSSAAPKEEEEWPFLCGMVVDETGEPVVGARVMLADLDVGASSSRNGRFCVSAPVGDRTLSVTALGFVPSRRLVTLAAGGSELLVVLKAAP